MGGKKRVAKTVKKLKGQKIDWKWKRDRAPHFSHPMLGPGGGNIGRGKPLPEECQGSGMLEEERKTSKPPVPRGLVGFS